MPETPTTVETFLWLAEADVATSVLRACGMECYLADQYFLFWFPLHALAIGGVKLRVKESDAADAKEILHWANMMKRSRCFRCGSDNVRMTMPAAWLMVLLVLCPVIPLLIFALLACTVFGILIRGLGTRWRCKACGFRWKLDDEQPGEDASEAEADDRTDS